MWQHTCSRSTTNDEISDYGWMVGKSEVIQLGIVRISSGKGVGLWEVIPALGIDPDGLPVGRKLVWNRG